MQGYDHIVQDNFGLSNDQIGHACPAVLKTEAHESRSERYLEIPTIDILGALRNISFVPTLAMQSTSRMPGRTPFTKHLLRLRQEKHLGTWEDDVPEIVLINSHDGTSAYKLMAGIFRMVCSNGLITGDINTTIRVPHRNNLIESILKATVTVAEQAEYTLELANEMKQIALTDRERFLLATYAAKERYGIDEANTVEGSLVDTVNNRLNPAALLIPRRYEDGGHDLYTTVNVIQERAMRGGTRVKGGRKGREIRGIDQTVQFNQRLWSFAQELRSFKLKG